MRSGGDRPPPSWEVALSPVRRRLSERPRLTEFDCSCLIEGYGATAAAIVGVHQPNVVWQLARHYRLVPGALDDRQLIWSHTINCGQTNWNLRTTRRRFLEVLFEQRVAKMMDGFQGSSSDLHLAPPSHSSSSSGGGGGGGDTMAVTTTRETTR